VVEATENSIGRLGDVKNEGVAVRAECRLASSETKAQPGMTAATCNIDDDILLSQSPLAFWRK